MSHKPHFGSVQMKIIVPLALFMVVYAAFNSLHYPAQQARLINAKYHIHLRLELDKLILGTSLSFGSGDLAGVQKTIDKIKEDEELAFLLVLDEDGEVLTRHGDYDETLINEEMLVQLADGEFVEIGNYLMLKDAIHVDGEMLGWGIIALETQGREQAIADSLQFTLVLSLLLTALGIGLVFYVTRTVVLRPIAKLSNLAMGIRQGDLRQSEVEVRSQDEIGVLTQTFNEMLGVLRQLATQAEEIADGQFGAKIVREKMSGGEDFLVATAFISEANEQTEGDLAEAFDKMTTALRRLTVQAIIIARDDLDNPVLDVEVPGELGVAFREMIERMQWIAGQANYIANDDLHNSNLQTESDGVLGRSMAHMVINLRQTQQDLKERTEAAVERQRHILKVAEQVMDASNNIASASEELARTAAQMATGSEKQQGTVEGTTSALEQMTQSAHGVSDNMDDLSRLMTENSAALNQLSSSVVLVTQNAEQMSQTVMANSSAIEELAASVQTQADGAQMANETVQETSRVAENGAQVVREAMGAIERIAERVRSSASTIGELGKSSEQISTIVGVINDIADQTNLLALNAAIEAARAGEQGKGFMVVADEVRKLAERTSQATQEIDAMIRRIQTETQEVVTSMETGMSEVEQGTELAGKAGEAIAEIGDGIGKVNTLIGQLTEASREQAITSDEIVSSTAEMNELVQQVAGAMGQQSQAVEVVNRGSEAMQGRVDQVAQVVRQQTEATTQVAHSMEEVNGVASEALQSAREMDTATGKLARQAEDLNALAASFEEVEETTTGDTNGSAPGSVPRSNAVRG